jgi:hypothetical protein
MQKTSWKDNGKKGKQDRRKAENKERGKTGRKKGNSVRVCGKRRQGRRKDK